jgi:hypothetical protein
MPRRATALLPPAELLREFLDYSPETGILKWRERDPHHFASPRLWRSWNTQFAGKDVGWINANGYLATRIQGPSFLVQRVIWKLVTGNEPPEQIDHIDGNRINNRWKNLREIDAIQSAHNRGMHKSNKVGMKGVSKRGNTYIARIHPRGEVVYLGTFKTPEEASKAYEEASKHIFGEFYRNSDKPTKPSS